MGSISPSFSTPYDFRSLQELEQRLLDFQCYYGHIAKPYEWKFTRRDLKTLLNEIQKQVRMPEAAKKIRYLNYESIYLGEILCNMGELQRGPGKILMVILQLDFLFVLARSGQGLAMRG